MSTRTELAQSIATTTQDYRAGELPAPTPEHIERWVQQFAADVQLPLLAELDHVLKTTYIGRRRTVEFLEEVIETKALVGNDATAFWSSANVLDCQLKGRSQHEMRALLDGILGARLGIQLEQCGGSPDIFLYVDDAVFSGLRLGADLEHWIKVSAPPKATVHVVAMAVHTSGEYLATKRLKKVAAEAGKQVTINIWRETTIENRRWFKDTSEVLWPSALPDDVAVRAYAASEKKWPWEPRNLGGAPAPFTSEEGRQLLEREFVQAGVRIRSHHGAVDASLRPLGFSAFGLGFGSMIVTYRNCPNNTPLALWWGNPAGMGAAHFDKWIPLFPRKTYG